MLKAMSSLAPATVTSAVKPPVMDLPFLSTFFRGDVALLETEYRQINFIDWGDAVTKTPVEFFTAVRDYTDAEGEPCFKTLSSYALCVISLPISNADANVERMFSQVNLIKSNMYA